MPEETEGGAFPPLTKLGELPARVVSVARTPSNRRKERERDAGNLELSQSHPISLPLPSTRKFILTS